MSDLIKRLRLVRGSFIIPVESPNVFAWAEEAADALERMTADRDRQKKSREHWSQQYHKAEKRIEQFEVVLDKLARLGNEPHYGNSHGNTIARKALDDE